MSATGILQPIFSLSNRTMRPVVAISVSIRKRIQSSLTAATAVVPGRPTPFSRLSPAVSPSPPPGRRLRSSNSTCPVSLCSEMFNRNGPGAVAALMGPDSVKVFHSGANAMVSLSPTLSQGAALSITLIPTRLESRLLARNVNVYRPGGSSRPLYWSCRFQLALPGAVAVQVRRVSSCCSVETAPPEFCTVHASRLVNCSSPNGTTSALHA